uniref:Uncharacterized protein n=1 Tax=Arundo donax TaxID=35708 RepID=A0A0A8Z108_ARUDO
MAYDQQLTSLVTYYNEKQWIRN